MPLMSMRGLRSGITARPTRRSMSWPVGHGLDWSRMRHWNQVSQLKLFDSCKGMLADDEVAPDSVECERRRDSSRFASIDALKSAIFCSSPAMASDEAARRRIRVGKGHRRPHPIAGVAGNDASDRAPSGDVVTVICSWSAVVPTSVPDRLREDSGDRCGRTPRPPAARRLWRSRPRPPVPSSLRRESHCRSPRMETRPGTRASSGRCSSRT